MSAQVPNVIDDAQVTVANSSLAKAQPSMSPAAPSASLPLPLPVQAAVSPPSEPSTNSELTSIGVQTVGVINFQNHQLPLWILFHNDRLNDSTRNENKVPIRLRREFLAEAIASRVALPVKPVDVNSPIGTQTGTTSIGVQTDATPWFHVVTSSWLPAGCSWPQQPHIVEDNNQTAEPVAIPNLEAKPRRIFPLYSDVMQIVFPNLTVNEMLIAIRLSKQWYHAFNSMQPLALTSHSSNLLFMPIQSAFARHIAHATNFSSANRQWDKDFFIDESMLPYTAVLLPNLVSLSADPMLKPANSRIGDWRFPSSLRTLEIRSDWGAGYWAREWCASHFPAIGKLQQLRELRLQMESSNFKDEIDFSPLCSLSQLQVLDVEFRDSYHKQAQTLASLKRLVQQSSLTELSLCLPSFDDEGDYSQIFSLPTSDAVAPYPLRDSGKLTSIRLRWGQLDRELLQAFTQFPCLTHLSTDQINLDSNDMEMLSQLPNITELDMYARDTAITNGDAIVVACRNLPHLRRLMVRIMRFSTDHLDACLPHLPQLTDVDLDGRGGSGSDSFSCVLKYGLPQRLKCLSLRNFSASPTDLVDYIFPLQNLENLRLSNVFSQNFDKPDLCARLDVLIPKLHQFDFPKLQDFSFDFGLRVTSLIDYLICGAGYQYDFKLGTSENRFAPSVEYWHERTLSGKDIYQCITLMKQYENKSFEELRLEDEELGVVRPAHS